MSLGNNSGFRVVIPMQPSNVCREQLPDPFHGLPMLLTFLEMFPCLHHGYSTTGAAALAVLIVGRLARMFYCSWAAGSRANPNEQSVVSTGNGGRNERPARACRDKFKLIVFSSAGSQVRP